MHKNKYFLFTENPPLKSKGFGFSVLLYEIIAANSSIFDSIITFWENDSVSIDEIKETNVKTVIIDQRKVYSRFENYKARYLLSILFFLLALPRLVRLLNKRKKSPILFCVGTSSKILIYTWILKKMVSNPIHIYLVDDIILVNEHIGNKFDGSIAKFLLNKLLKNCAKIFCISEGLKTNLQQFGVHKIEVIMPVFRKVEPSRFEQNLVKKGTDNLKIVFTGGLNFLYSDTIQIFDHFISNYNRQHGCKHQITIQTYSPKKKFDELNLSEFSVYRTSANRELAADVLYNADVLLIPYSFDDNSKNMVITSFPQKFAQLIQLNIPLFVFAPSYSSVGDFCQIHKVGYLCSSVEEASIFTVFDEMLRATRPSNYTDCYEKYFSPEVASKILISNL
ncbi:MAG: hypothetical protein ACKVOU_10190 [Cytophagales bacterium]